MDPTLFFLGFESLSLWGLLRVTTSHLLMCVALGLNWFDLLAEMVAMTWLLTGVALGLNWVGNGFSMPEVLCHFSV